NRFARALEKAVAAPGDARAKAGAAGEAYLRFALENPAAYKLMFDLNQANPEAYPELVRAEERARATMTAYVDPPAGASGEAADRELIGRAYWAALHGPLMLQFSGKLGAPYDAVTVIKALMKALWSGLPASGGAP
ncbi:MAG: TetR-like C-terminal domain-containing protein, partial [Candidatus Dormibacteria bacterium]